MDRSTLTKQAGEKILRLDARDNVAVALEFLPAGEEIAVDGHRLPLNQPVEAKHKIALEPMDSGAAIWMYGVLVGRTRTAIPAGGLLTTQNVSHDAAGYAVSSSGHYAWTPPDVERWRGTTFDGFRRADGQVGTRNYWLVIPLVFCENRNVEALREALEEELGYTSPNVHRALVRTLAAKWRGSAGAAVQSANPKIFSYVDGIRFLTHQGGCGGTREDAQALCGLLAGYIHHPNVAGATVLSLAARMHSQRCCVKSWRNGGRQRSRF